jgi:hypothetical protein
MTFATKIFKIYFLYLMKIYYICNLIAKSDRLNGSYSTI